jgi:hypothetical protein
MTLSFRRIAAAIAVAASFILERVAVPVLAVAHKDDGCRGTPPEDADEIVAASPSTPCP